jgi:large subunit ribosomal protein L24
MMKIREGDTVEIIRGDERGQRGTVRQVLRAWRIDRFQRRIARDPDHDQVIVGGHNIIKKHQRPTGQTRTQTGIIEREAPLYLSKVALVCPHCNEWTRVGFGLGEGGGKVRVCKRCGEAIS